MNFKWVSKHEETETIYYKVSKYRFSVSSALFVHSQVIIGSFPSSFLNLFPSSANEWKNISRKENIALTQVVNEIENLTKSNWIAAHL